jgi:hypothetical protein
LYIESEVQEYVEPAELIDTQGRKFLFNPFLINGKEKSGGGWFGCQK